MKTIHDINDMKYDTNYHISVDSVLECCIPCIGRTVHNVYTSRATNQWYVVHYTTEPHWLQDGRCLFTFSPLHNT